MSGDDGERVSARVPAETKEWLGEMAKRGNTTVSELVRRAVGHMREAQDPDSLAREGEIREEIDNIIEENKQIRRLAPSKWRSHVRRLFLDDLRDDCAPRDLKRIAEGYRRQADKMEDLAAEVPYAPEADLVTIVDEELRHALEAADLSTWYDGVENPHERHLAGVEEGREERDDLVALIQGVVDRHEHLAAVFDDLSEAPPVDGEDLPTLADSLLPDDVDRADVAELATQLIREGVAAEDVPDVLPTIDPAIGAEEIEGHVEDVDTDREIEPATITRGGDTIEEDSDDVDDGQPLAVEASEGNQEQLVRALAAADGGRDPDSVPGAENGEVDTETMSDQEDETTESTDTDQPDVEDVEKQMEKLTEQAKKMDEEEGHA